MEAHVGPAAAAPDACATPRVPRAFGTARPVGPCTSGTLARATRAPPARHVQPRRRPRLPRVRQPAPPTRRNPASRTPVLEPRSSIAHASLAAEARSARPAAIEFPRTIWGERRGERRPRQRPSSTNGEGGIRTPDGLTPIPVFETGSSRPQRRRFAATSYPVWVSGEVCGEVMEVVMCAQMAYTRSRHA
jgi:hypothetical protein